MKTLPKLNVLTAYPYFSDKLREVLESKDPNSFRLIVDSGAFTAWNTGVEITMEGYMRFLTSLPTQWDKHVVQLDVFGNPDATYENWHRMLDAGFTNIMPVFTRGDSLERLEEFYSVTDYIMFGGIVIGGENVNYVKWFLDNNKGRKAHWLGFVNMPFIQKYQPESVDSSSATSALRYGHISYYVGGGKLKNMTKRDFAIAPPRQFVNSCARIGFRRHELRHLGKEQAWVDSSKQPLNRFAGFVNYCHHVYRSIEVEKKLGTKIYLAVSTDIQMRLVFKAYEFLRERGTI